MKIVFAGTPEFAAVVLQSLVDGPHELLGVYTQPDRPAGRGRRMTASPVKRLAEACALPVYQPQGLRDPTVARALSELGADLMVVVAYGLLLPPAVLAAPPLGCINVHASLLPRWRGAAPIQRAIIAGDRETGVSVMQMDEGLDTGDVLYRLPCPIEDADTGQSLHDRLAGLGARALGATLAQIESGCASADPQDNAAATYAPRIDKAEALLNWSQPAPVLARVVRAFNPWPVAFTTVRGERLRIWEAMALDAPAGAAPGSVVAAGAAGIDVAAAEGRLRLCSVQRPGARAVSATEYLNAHPLQIGEKLGAEEGPAG